MALAPFTTSDELKDIYEKIKAVVPNFRSTTTISPGDNIQAALDNLNTLGGGTLYLSAGTYTQTSNLTGYSNVTLQGQDIATTIIDFGNAAYNLTLSGSNAYTTGTIAISHGSASLTGSGTTWTVAMQGRSVIINGIWYEIATVNNTTSITLVDTLAEDTVSGIAYAIATPATGIAVSDLSLENSTAATGALYCLYVDTPVLTNVSVFDSTIGVNINNSSAFFLDDVNAFTCGTGIKVTNSNSTTYNNFFIFDATVNGLEMSRVINCQIANFSINGCGGDAINLTSCSNVGILDFSIDRNTGKGINLVSGCNDIEMVVGTITNSGSDGVKLTATSDRNTINCLNIENSGGYGINIAASTCDNNTVLLPIYVTNTSGNLHDLGTGTINFVGGFTGVATDKDSKVITIVNGLITNVV